MLFKCFLICLFLREILGAPSPNEEGVWNYIFEDEVMKALEELRKIMKEGDSANGIPPMEPLELGDITVDFYLEDTDLIGKLKNTVIKNLSDFEVKNLTLNISPKMEAKVKVLFEQVYISGYYDLRGTLFGEYPVKGVGTHKIKLSGFTMSLEGSLRSKAGMPNVRHLNATVDVEGISGLWGEVPRVIVTLARVIQKGYFTHAVSYINLLEGDYEQSFKQEFLLHILHRFRSEYLPPLLNTLKIVINDFLVKIFTTQESISSNILSYTRANYTS